MAHDKEDLTDKAVKTLQMLAVDAVEKAASGHPGTPMGLADISVELWTRYLRFDPREPQWPDRDRFVLSCGHASMLLYGLLHLTGYAVSLDDIKAFRQWNSKTPGHPEVHLTPGVETTTGPLGQGISNAVGMAVGLKMLAARFNPHERDLVSARVYCIASDGDVMEGVSGEASSVAGFLGLDNLVCFYDDNGITIDGKTELAFSEDVGKRYEAYGWFVQHIDGHDRPAIRAALDRAIAEQGRPSLIVAKTHIGKGSPNKQDTAAAHGEKLGGEEVRLTKQNIGWPEEPTFLVPDDVRAFFAEPGKRGAALRKAWQAKLEALGGRAPAARELWDALHERRVPSDLLAQLAATLPTKTNATRNTAGEIEQRVAALVPALVGGSADLTGSTKTYIAKSDRIHKGAFEGRNFHFGVREHAMGAIANGLALTEAFIPFTATFLVFSDYMRPAMRLAALSHLQSIFVFTHDSLYLGEDGPTHQPVEHYWALRAIPNLDLFRPADALECAAAWVHALGRSDGPTAFALTRQNVPNLERKGEFFLDTVLRGAYVLDDADGAPTHVVIATGSEVHVAVAAKAKLGDAGRGVRVVSAPCWDAFERQDAAYKATVLPPGVPRCSFELGITQPWRGVVGDGGLTIGHDDFGHSAPWEVIQEKLGFTADAVAARLAAWM
jgi:transketolase